MIKLVYSVGVLSLVLAGVPCMLCGMQWRGTAGADDALRLAVGKRVSAADRAGPREKDVGMTPLVAQATAFALYLNPPKPPVPAQTPPRANAPQPAPKPVVVAPKFRLLSTSCNALRPEKSLALISEPGRGDRWIRKGDRLGHLVVESIQDGALVYRDGNQLRQETVAIKQTAELARPAPVPVAAGTNELDRPAGNDRPVEYEQR